MAWVPDAPSGTHHFTLSRSTLVAFTDDFNRADSATVGNGWIESVAAVWSILSNKLRHTPNNSSYLTQQAWRPTTENFANGIISVEWKRSSTSQYPIICARKQAGADTYYMAWLFGSSTIYLSKVVSGTRTDLTSKSVSALSTTGNTFKFTFTLDGSTLTLTVDGITNPGFIDEITTTDSSITATGQSGLSGATGSGPTLDYDNFSAAMTIDATKSVADDGVGTDAVAVEDTSGNKNPIDSGTGTESIGISVTAPVADAGQGADSVAITVFINVEDSGAGEDTPAIVQPAMLGLLERFDGTLADWTLDTSGGTAQIQTVNNDEKLVLNDISGSALVSATRIIEGQSAPFCIEVDIYAGTGAIGLLEALDGSDNVLFSIKADANTLLGTFDTDAAAASTFALTASKYYNIVFYCDPLADTVRAWYITGAGTAPQTWVAIGATKSYSGALVSKIRLTTDSTATGEARFDEVKVFRPNVFCIGDSNTAGYKSSAPYWNPSPDSSQRLGSGEDEVHSYPHLLGLKFNPVQWAANRGLNAAVSANLDSRIQGDVIDQGAQTVVILIGTNDIDTGVSLATIEANIQSAANKAATAGLTVCLCSVPPCNTWDSTQNTKRSSLNAWIESHCSANGYRFADVYTAVKNPSNPDQLDPAYNAGDGLHFTTAGLQVIADTVYSSLLETKTITDTATGADSIEVRNLVSLVESGAGAESLDILGLVSVADSGVGADSLSIFAAVQLLELASAVEGLVAGGAWVPYSVADSGTGVDTVSAIIKDGATLQNIYDLTLTRLAAFDYIAPDNAGISTAQTLLRGVEKWKNNKLARTAVVGKIETWVLYDDDGIMPLLTWTHDTSTLTRNRAY